MTNRILLYGATGFSGRLIAEEARRRLTDRAGGDIEVVLGGRDRLALEQMSDDLGLDHVVFALDDRIRVAAALSGFGVLLNAAGPFAATAVRLGRSAIASGCHYVDINGEVDVYQALDDLGRTAKQRGVTMVSGAGFTAAVSDVMLEWALGLLKHSGWDGKRLGAVRVAVGRMTDLSRGSIRTMLRSVREEVITVRHGAYVHVPVGRVERAFEFGPPPSGRESASSHIATATNMLDTLTAFNTLTRHKVRDVSLVESYVDTSRTARWAYQLGAWTAVFLQVPGVQQATQLQIDQLPEGPDEDARSHARETVLLQIDSPFSEPWVDWRMETPNSYDVTAACALSVASKLATGDVDLRGWRTPAEVLATGCPVSTLQTKGVAVPVNEPFPVSSLEGRDVLSPD